MRTSIIRLGEVFVKAREGAIPVKGVYARQGFQIIIANTSLMFGFFILMYNFGMPTPDLRHDFRCLILPEFKQYSDNQQKVYLEKTQERQMRQFRFHDGKMQSQAMFGPYNEDVFKVQDFVRKT